MKAIAVIDKNLAIGKLGDLLCRLPKDLANFKKLTLGKTLIIGRKTLESLPGGRPLTGRSTIVLTQNTNLDICVNNGEFKNCIHHSKKEALAHIFDNIPSQDIFVAGGEQIYRLFLSCCDELILTELECEFEDADAFFPNFKDEFKLEKQGELTQDNGYTYRINRYIRI